MVGLLYNTLSLSQEMHVQQNSGGYFHISSFNSRVTHFQILRYSIYGENGENEDFCVWKWRLNEDHFSSLVLIRTKSSIEDFYGSTDECFQVANKVLTCIGKILHRTRQPCPHWSMSWKKKFCGNCLFFDYEKSLTHCVVFLEGSQILAANFVGGRSWPTSLQIRFKKLQIAN